MDEDLIDQIDPDFEDVVVPVHGVLAPEGVFTRDKRKFDPDSLWWGQLPIPLLYQERTAEGHDFSVIVGMIEEIVRRDGLLHWGGTMLASEEAAKAVTQIAQGALSGVSVDVFDAVVEHRTAEDEPITEEMLADGFDDDIISAFTKGEVGGATIVAFPAYREAYIALGPMDASLREVEDDDEDDEIDALAASAHADLFAISEKDWDGSSSRFTPQEWYRSTIVHLSDDRENKSDHKLPIREPNGDLSRAGVHAAAARINQVDAPEDKLSAARSALRAAYKQLDEDPPESLTASAEFVDVAPGRTEDGPGWLTHPIPTDRLRDYWTKGPGAAKIGWGAPGDFRRCEALLAPYVKPQHLAGYCANRHYDALGTWPGRHSAHSTETASEPYVIVASGRPAKPPREWFEDPKLVGPSPLTVTEDGRVFGHVATWETCHISYAASKCIQPPHSASDYAHFCTGAMLTDDGSQVRVGTLVVDTTHAADELTAAGATKHYDDTGKAAAYVSAGEDAYGIWIAGAVSPRATEEDIVALRASKLSGDWRRIGGGLEMVGALAVNVGGFPIPRSRETAEGVLSLVAAGVVPRGEFTTDETPTGIADAVSAELDRREKAAEARARMAALQVRRNRERMEKIKERIG